MQTYDYWLCIVTTELRGKMSINDLNEGKKIIQNY